MRVLVGHNAYQYYGGEDRVFEDEQWLLRKHGHEVITFEKDNGGLRNNLKTAIGAIWNQDIYRQLRRMIQRFRPDLLHFHNTFPQISPAAYHAAQHESVPVVQSVHNYRLLCPGSTLMRDNRICKECCGQRIAWQGIRHKCYRNSRAATAVTAAMLAAHWTLKTWQTSVAAYIALTDFSREQLSLGGFPRDKIHVKPNFVSPDPGSDCVDGEYAIFVGRLSPEKGIETMLSAWQSEDHDTKDLPPLKIIGEGPLREATRQAAVRSNGLIECLGLRPFADVMSLLSRARMLIFPSIWHEPFGRSVIEAFATSTPVIASNIEPLNSIVHHNQTGMLFETGNPSELRRCVQQMQADHELRVGLGTAARKEFLDKFTADTNYAQLMTVYESVVEGKAKKRPAHLETLEN